MQLIRLIYIDYTICFSDCQEKKGLYFLKETYYDVTVQLVHSNTFLGAHKTHFGTCKSRKIAFSCNFDFAE